MKIGNNKKAHVIGEGQGCAKTKRKLRAQRVVAQGRVVKKGYYYDTTLCVLVAGRPALTAACVFAVPHIEKATK